MIIDLLTSLTVREVLIMEETKKSLKKMRFLRGDYRRAKTGKNRIISSRL